jgi:hypothetical protein
VFGFVEMVFTISKIISSRVPIKALILFLRAKVKNSERAALVQVVELYRL